jgi:tetratricopeptide (TPR) repeat protein
MPEARLRAEAVREQALAFLSEGQGAAALAAYDEALGLARECGDAAFVDWMYACRAAAAVDLGPCDEELVELKRILLRSSDPATTVRAANSVARIYELRHDLAKARFYNRNALGHAERLGDPLILSHCENQSGNLLATDCRFEEAAAVYRAAIARSGDDDTVPRLYVELWRENLGYCLLSLDRIPEGLPLIHDALAYFESVGASEHSLFALQDLCFGYVRSDRHEEARYFGEAALERLGASPQDVLLEKNLLYLVGEACQASGDLDGARGYFDRLASHYPEFRNLRAYLEAFDFRNVINLRA